jgi:hypothetical protein
VQILRQPASLQQNQTKNAPARQELRTGHPNNRLPCILIGQKRYYQQESGGSAVFLPLKTGFVQIPACIA